MTVMHGGVGRVLAPGDDPATPTAQVVKDVWVVGGPAPSRIQVRTSQPQVDFGSSVPKRAADALYWLGRAAERAEVAARTTRVVGAQVQQDPSLLTVGGGGVGSGRGRTAARCAGPADRVDDAAVTDPAWPPCRSPIAAARVDATVRRSSPPRSPSLAAGGCVGARVPVDHDTGRVLGRLTRIRADLLSADAAPDDLDIVLVDLAALAGLSMESTVRGPAWRFLDLGRRLERALAAARLGARRALGLAAEPLAFQPLADRCCRRTRAWWPTGAGTAATSSSRAVLDLLVHDDGNPRSLAFQLDRLREHMASLAWQEGADLVQQARSGAHARSTTPWSAAAALSVDSLVLSARGPLLDLANADRARAGSPTR